MRCNPLGASTISRVEMRDSEDSQSNAPEHHVRRADHGPLTKQSLRRNDQGAPGSYFLATCETHRNIRVELQGPARPSS